jgi:hypothetical protein
VHKLLTDLEQPGRRCRQIVQHSQVSEFECFLLRYVPNVVTGEFVNLGLVMWESGVGGEPLVDIRFRQDWSRAQQFDPDADVEVSP